MLSVQTLASLFSVNDTTTGKVVTTVSVSVTVISQYRIRQFCLNSSFRIDNHVLSVNCESKAFQFISTCSVI